jgi:hypothetical protein
VVSDPPDHFTEHDVVAVWLALTDEQRDDLLAARNNAKRQQKGQDDEPE